MGKRNRALHAENERLLTALNEMSTTALTRERLLVERNRLVDEKREHIADLVTELEDKAEQITELNKTVIDLRRLRTAAESRAIVAEGKLDAERTSRDVQAARANKYEELYKTADALRLIASDNSKYFAGLADSAIHLRCWLDEAHEKLIALIDAGDNLVKAANKGSKLTSTSKYTKTWDLTVQQADPRLAESEINAERDLEEYALRLGPT